MNTFPVRRLIPFFVVTVRSEGLYLLLQLINNFGVLDLRPLALVQTLGVLLLTTLVSFLFMVIPYVLYLLFIPSARVNVPSPGLFSLCLFFSLCLKKPLPGFSGTSFNRPLISLPSIIWFIPTRSLPTLMNLIPWAGFSRRCCCSPPSSFMPAGVFFFRRRHRRISAAACSQPRFTPLSACWPITMLTSAAWR